MARQPVELTESARKKVKKAELLKSTGKGKARKSGRDIVRQESRNNSALAAAQRALGTRRNNQTTDSNN